MIQENQEVAIDLPMKLLVWKDEGGKTILSRNAISWLIDRHELTGEEAPAMLEKKVQSMVQETIA